jgi:hypothetical protein
LQGNTDKRREGFTGLERKLGEIVGKLRKPEAIT